MTNNKQDAIIAALESSHQMVNLLLTRLETSVSTLAVLASQQDNQKEVLDGLVKIINNDDGTGLQEKVRNIESNIRILFDMQESSKQVREKINNSLSQFNTDLVQLKSWIEEDEKRRSEQKDLRRTVTIQRLQLVSALGVALITAIAAIVVAFIQ